MDGQLQRSVPAPISPWASDRVAAAVAAITPLAARRTAAVKPGLARVLEAFAAERLGPHHFASVSGYGHGDLGREVLDRVFARVLGAESAAVRLQFVSGTHAIASALYGVLRPGDRLLALTGRPYDTLEEVIGLRGSGQGSLAEFGIHYDELELDADGRVDAAGLADALAVPTRMVLIQRSCGYSWRPSLAIAAIGALIERVKALQPGCLCFVDNCYGEFVEACEPPAVGADLIAGSLIKNPGGTLAPTGGYVAGRSELVEQACCRLTAPGIGREGGTGFDLYRLLFQGLFLAPQMVAEALISAELVGAVFASLGYAIQPLVGGERSDVIQAVRFGAAGPLQTVCRAFQACSPVGSYLDPLPAPMPGYASELVMAGGSFIDGSTSEFSADAPLREPYVLFSQGGSHHCHAELALERALTALEAAGQVPSASRLP
ncbi:methionine gamma-lyase family protein [Synechococcus sp. CS-602]|uniref:methionine gamma-lyase family protein n=1 Tax=Synechococcaceae TaxID=1890426 RepID=UPI0008FF0672|nr:MULTISPECIES: methionine gamma-lyase family protein [Synechococcaceae]MCT4365984.1 methionine gamma-lyase family protein [Candidatus Regnicoccus frigidus MAG-AL1]APD47704.1 aluminum resistance family protein [Synechococcus sp. SynAce01]MCT0204193.1 methionine gamma-lyase family protein [Synechococcus sp. CS-602]MCT0247320.1 methionine gamma-lyase family protein [Synechococcus sp. CS-601]MCT4366039.1 methionine gamma-lyase family protein [Candidatus Regnicoccus frigidus MAG-AL2]